jgi:single-strand DNA-binding protein
MLRVTLLGNLGADPESRYTQKGTQMVTFRVAVNQIRTGPDGERQESTEWFRVRISGRQAEYATRLTKGTRVLVAGRLDIGHYQSRDGESKTSFDVWADEIQSVSARQLSAEAEALPQETDEAERAVAAGVSSVASRPRANGKPRTPAAAEDLEDLPF